MTDPAPARGDLALAAVADVPDPVPGPRPRLVLVGGIPGAGKSTALARVAASAPRARVLDSEWARHRLRARFPGVPYPVLRPVVHAWHAVRVLAAVLSRPVAEGSGQWPVLLVHDPATRRWRRAMLGLLARVRGRSTVLVVLDVSVEDAAQGQRERGRVVRGRAFARHWRRWEAQRGRLAASAVSGRGPWWDGGWDETHVVGRGAAVGVLLRVVEVSASPGRAPRAARRSR